MKTNILFLFFLFMATNVWPFSLTPMSLSFAPSGKDSVRSFQLENQSGEKMAVEITAYERIMDEKGVENNKRVQDTFLIFPQQMVLAPNSTSTFRVKWNGPQDIKQELSYRIVAEQLPIQFKKEEKNKRAQIKILLRYEAAVYVTPQRAKPKVIVEKSEISDGKLLLVLKNRGNKHQIIHEPTVTLSYFEKKSSKNLQSYSITENKLKFLQGENILSHSLRKMIIPLPKKIVERIGKLKQVYVNL